MNIVVATVFLALSCATVSRKFQFHVFYVIEKISNPFFFNFLQIISGSSVDDSNNFEKTFKHRALIEELKEKTKCFDENISSTFKFMLEDAKIGIKSNKIQSQRPRLAMNYINLKTAQKEWFVTHDQFTRFEDELKICLKLYEYSSSQEKNR